ncbi:D-hexose-6-phosphate mutarotase [Aureliella helgolandensis]|uniref:Putative glucose-6-phosphate 1-epimerase n=1 Tax=Aureliella helgolandensis TaxID=2527968 RepID=A0A518GG17_9BACT|nr:D-hexose-6-phosphate mutarotase [Aureliella helgolandensis]QDV27533.1 Putative glucose-6-phosphate 1-epimerase [Aureliella helgolandensis]
MPQNVERLSAKFAHPGLRFTTGRGGLVKAVVETAKAQGEIYLHGAHVTHFAPSGQAPVLWVSEQSWYEPTKPIRGGIPICFPWFGGHPSAPSQPSHGTARITTWEVTAVEAAADDGVAISLQNAIHPFQVTYRVEFGTELQLTLTVELPDTAPSPARYEEALHTYLAIGDIHQTRIEGLESTAYIDKVAGGDRQPASGEAIRFSGELDRVYLNTSGACRIFDPLAQREIRISKSGSQSTVVWNPWIGKSDKMPDFGAQEWTGMVCVETANVGDNAVEIAPGSAHTMTAKIQLQ